MPSFTVAIIIITVYLQLNVDHYRWIIYNTAELLVVAEELGIKLSYARTGKGAMKNNSCRVEGS